MGTVCHHAALKKAPPLVVLQRRCNRSAFNGYRWTPSDYSEVGCLECRRTWRTKARYVDRLPDFSGVW